MLPSGCSLWIPGGLWMVAVISWLALVPIFSFNFKDSLCHTVYIKHGLLGGFPLSYGSPHHRGPYQSVTGAHTP